MNLPKDLAIAIIMDGNGRWAAARDLPVTDGHRAGGRALRRTVEAALELSVSELTVYAFSTENWTRSPDEVAGLMQLFCDLLDSEVPDLDEQGVKVRFIGGEAGLPDPVLERMTWARELTAGNERMTLVIAFNYGGRAEIVQAARRAAAQHGVDGIDDDTIAAALHAPDLRDPDMIVRTAGEQRTSNFLVWQGAYSELVFTDVLWPDFDLDALRACIVDYAGRERRYGGRLDGENAKVKVGEGTGAQ
jgi:undecaprenyl diphosphate synthase